jgi:hypothetical protein
MMDEICKMMRRLTRYGVTHFVVSDELHDRFKAENERKAFQFHWNFNPDPDAPLYFRQRRLIRQADLAHLPYDATPKAPEPEPALDPDVQFLNLRAWDDFYAGRLEQAKILASIAKRLSGEAKFP